MNLSSDIQKIINDYDINIIESHKRKSSETLQKIIISTTNRLMFPSDRTIITYLCKKCNKRISCIVWKCVWKEDFCNICYFQYYNPECDNFTII